MQTSSSSQTTREPAFFGSFFQKACVSLSLRPSSSVSSTTGKPIPHTFCFFPGWGFSMGTNYHFHSWRVFVIVCALPCTVSMVALKFMPESPRFLLEVSLQGDLALVTQSPAVCSLPVACCACPCSQPCLSLNLAPFLLVTVTGQGLKLTVKQEGTLS